MQTEFVIVVCDVHCKWTGEYPRYRCFVNDELFAERTWRWTDSYLEEMLQIEAEPGKYWLRWELVKPCLAQLTVTNVRVDLGPGRVKNNVLLRIG